MQSFSAIWWFGAESNRRHADFQSAALPTELPNHHTKPAKKAFLAFCKGFKMLLNSTHKALSVVISILEITALFIRLDLGFLLTTHKA